MGLGAAADDFVLGDAFGETAERGLDALGLGLGGDWFVGGVGDGRLRDWQVGHGLDGLKRGQGVKLGDGGEAEIEDGRLREFDELLERGQGADVDGGGAQVLDGADFGGVGGGRE